MARRLGSALGTLGLALGGTLLALLATEAGVRGWTALHVPDADLRVPPHVHCNCPFLYEPNPAHPDHSAQGLRDRVRAIPKPEGVYRILVLGDSVTYGSGVGADRTFPSRLEARLTDRATRTEVVNAAVSGYTTYNELHWYLARGRTFEPDLVVLAVCLNDVVNPRLHWDHTRIPVVPEEAIPNHAYDRQHVQPRLARLLDPRQLARSHPSPLRRSQLFGLVESRLAGRATREELAGTPEERSAVVAGRRWPTYLTLEDPLGIQVLLDWESPEWQWLRGLLDRLSDAVRADGARLALLVLPLGYQLEPGYPFLPQGYFARYCAERGIPCLDPLPRLRAHGRRGLPAAPSRVRRRLAPERAGPRPRRRLPRRVAGPARRPAGRGAPLAAAAVARGLGSRAAVRRGVFVTPSRTASAP